MENGPRGSVQDSTHAPHGRAVSSSSTSAQEMSGKAKKKVAIVLFRSDLRVHDNASLYHAHYDHQSDGLTHILPVYVFDERFIELSGLPDYHRKGGEARTRVCGFWRTGVHRAKFLTESVYDVRDRLRDRGSDLLIRFGITEDIVTNIVKTLQEPAFNTELVAIHLQKEVCSEEVAQETGIAQQLASLGLKKDVLVFHDTKPWLDKSALPFTVEQIPDVFTPFRKKIEALGDKMSRPLLETPDKLLPFPYEDEQDPDDSIADDKYGNYGRNVMRDITLDNLLHYLLIPLQGSYEIKYGAPHFSKHKSSAFPWKGGETGALERLEWYFVTGDPPPVSRYKFTRNMLVGHAYSTKMSPYLCLGCISPRLIAKALEDHEQKFGSTQNTYWVRFEMLWRDYFLLISEKYGNNLFYLKGLEARTDPKMADKRAKEWNWFNDGENYLLQAWLRGRTGIPFIDANIIELRETGFMSNRGRQNVASFLTKDLCFDWRIGAEFFESHLIDYDPTANYGNWQYVAGTGNDARASRQFNPIKQARDYDPTGEYVRTWIPHLQDVPISKIHTPWFMSNEEWEKYCPDSKSFRKSLADETSSERAARGAVTSARNKLAPLNKANMDTQINAAKSIGLRPPHYAKKSASRSPLSSSSSNEGASTPSLSSGKSAFTEHTSGAGSGKGSGDYFEYSSPPSSSSNVNLRSGYENDNDEDDEGMSTTSSSNVRSSSNSYAPSWSGSSVQGHSHQSSDAYEDIGSDVRKQDVERLTDSYSLTVPDPRTAVGNRTTDIAGNDYAASIPYPRKPLFEQPSWKPHYFRKDLGRKKGGPGGGDSRRLIRPPKHHPPA